MKKKVPSSANPPATPAGQLTRLQRVLAAAGLGSRRDCEILITEGRVEVDGKSCTELGTKVDPETQEIRVDGERIRSQKPQYFMLNKPAGVLSTNEDPDGRTRVIDLIKTDLRVYNVGRLDQSSEGLIIVTNDGDLAYRLTHPKFGVEKRYLVQCVGCPTLEQLQQLERGVYLAEGKAKVERVSLKKKQRTGAVLEMVLTEGRNREIRRVLAAIGHKVTRLKRIAIGPLQLGELPAGAHRRLNPEEIKALKQAAAGAARRSTKPKPPTGPARSLAHLKSSQERPTPKSNTSSGLGRRLDRSSPAPGRRSATDRSSAIERRGGKFGRDPEKFRSGRDAAASRGPRGFSPAGPLADRPVGKSNWDKRGSDKSGSDKRGSDKRGSDKRGGGNKRQSRVGTEAKGLGGRSYRPEAPRRGAKRVQPARGAQGKPPRGPAGKNKFRKGR